MISMMEALVIAVFAVLFATASTQKYTSKYDTFDVDEVLRSERLFKNYVNCLLDQGPCTPEGSELKRNLPEALQTDCEKCTESQKKKAREAIEFIRKNKQAVWKQLTDKYDPNHVYRGIYRDRA